MEATTAASVRTASVSTRKYGTASSHRSQAGVSWPWAARPKAYSSAFQPTKAAHTSQETSSRVVLASKSGALRTRLTLSIARDTKNAARTRYSHTCGDGLVVSMGGSGRECE